MLCLPLLFSCGDEGLAIGDTYQGGIIFYLDGYGGGLISAPSDQSTGTAGMSDGKSLYKGKGSSGAEWGCYGIAISGSDGTDIGTGQQNTIDILAGCSQSGIAAKQCDNYNDGTYDDWFLPSKDELNEMYLNIGQGSKLGNVGGFSNYYYWSSTEDRVAGAWEQNFTNGYQNYGSETNTNCVRAIRAFKTID